MGWVESGLVCLPLSALLGSLGTSCVGMGFLFPCPAVAASVRSPTSVLVPTFLTPATPSIPTTPHPTLNSQQFDQQLQRYQRYLVDVGIPDILIVGSSRAVQGVDPMTLQRTLNNRGYKNVSIFNFGVNGATAQVVDFLLRQLLSPTQLPRLILWADGARALNSGRLDRTYQKIIASPGYRLLATGTRPVFLPSSGTTLERLCGEFPAQLGDVDRPLPVSPPGRYSPILELCDPQAKSTTPPGLLPKLNLQPPEVPDLHVASGFQSVATRFDPATYFRRYPKVPGNADGDYRNFTLHGVQTRALNNILLFARSQQIPVIFVNLPLTQAYLDSTRSSYEQQFRSFMRQYARSNALALYDLNQPWLRQNKYFADPSHLNHYGAAAVSAQVGRLLQLPSSSPVLPRN